MRTSPKKTRFIAKAKIRRFRVEYSDRNNSYFAKFSLNKQRLINLFQNEFCDEYPVKE